MFQELSPQNYHVLSPLYQPTGYHLGLQSIQLGLTPARVFVDDDSNPSAALTWYGHRYLLAGIPDNHTFNASVAQFFAQEVIPHEIEHANHWMSLYYTSDRWGTTIENHLLPEWRLTRATRQYYAYDASLHTDFDWHSQLPKDMTLQAVDAALIERTELQHIDILKDEMCSERPTVHDFLNRSFGVCLIYNDELAGWCLSEYNSAGRCEIGIETRPPYQRRGLATLMTRAFVDIAHAKGYNEIGWHCWASNNASGRTAIAAGFKHMCDYSSHLVRIKND